MSRSNTRRKTQRAVPVILNLTPNSEDKAIYEKALIMAMTQENISAS